MRKIFKTLNVFVLASFMGLFMQHQAIAGNFGVDLNDEVARVFFMQKIRNSNLHGNVSLLHEEEGGNILAGGLHVVEHYGTGIFLGLGAQLYAYDADLSANATFDDSGVALGVGGFGRWAFPTLSRLGLGGEIYYAPGVLAFNDTESFLEYAVRLEFHALRSADIYLGYRRVEIDIDEFGDVDFEKDAFIGARLTF